MSDILLELALILALLAVNGLLAMSEIAVVTARRARLARLAAAGDRRAAAALAKSSKSWGIGLRWLIWTDAGSTGCSSAKRVKRPGESVRRPYHL